MKMFYILLYHYLPQKTIQKKSGIMFTFGMTGYCFCPLAKD